MAIDTSALPFPKHPPAVYTSHRKDVLNAAKLAKAYAAVDLRDDKTCVVTGVPLVPFSQNKKRCLEHNHIKGRNVRPEWVYDSKRIFLVSRYVHDFITGSALQTIGTNANRPLKFKWNRRIVPAGKEPFRLRHEVAA